MLSCYCDWKFFYWSASVQWIIFGTPCTISKHTSKPWMRSMCTWWSGRWSSSRQTTWQGRCTGWTSTSSRSRRWCGGTSARISAFASSGQWIWCRQVQEPEDYYWWTSKVPYMSSKPLRVQTSMSRIHWPDRSLWSLVYRASDRSRGCRGCAWTRGGSWRRPWCWTWPRTCSSLSEVHGGQMQVCIKFIVGQFERKNIAIPVCHVSLTSKNEQHVNTTGPSTDRSPVFFHPYPDNWMFKILDKVCKNVEYSL